MFCCFAFGRLFLTWDAVASPLCKLRSSHRCRCAHVWCDVLSLLCIKFRLTGIAVAVRHVAADVCHVYAWHLNYEPAQCFVVWFCVVCVSVKPKLYNQPCNGCTTAWFYHNSEYIVFLLWRPKHQLPWRSGRSSSSGTLTSSEGWTPICFSPQVVEGILKRNGAADVAAMQLHKDQTEAHAMDIWNATFELRIACANTSVLAKQLQAFYVLVYSAVALPLFRFTCWGFSGRHCTSLCYCCLLLFCFWLFYFNSLFVY